MKYSAVLALLLSMTLLAGCTDRVNVEDISIALLVGIDIDDEERLVFTSSSPVFNAPNKNQEEIVTVHAQSLRQSRQPFDATITALTRRGKLQVLLIGERVVQHKNWLALLDTTFRDSKNTVLARVAVVNGNVSELMNAHPKDKPRLPLYLLKLIDTAHQRNITVATSLQELRRQYIEKGFTPRVTELKKDGDIKVTGLTLFNNSGIKKLSINSDDTKLLSILSNDIEGQFTFTVMLPDQPGDGIFHNNLISFIPNKIDVKIKPYYRNNRFEFKINVNMRISVYERLFLLDGTYNYEEIATEIAKQMDVQFKQLIKKVQKAKIDPFGWGLYARAYQYKAWKQVEDDWGDAFSKAKVEVTTSLKMQAMGSIK